GGAVSGLGGWSRLVRLVWPGRRRALPSHLRHPLAGGERVVAWAPAPPDGAVVATNLGLFLPGRRERLGWHEIHKATWDGRRLVVTPGRVVRTCPGYAVTEDAPPVTVRLPDPGDVPYAVRIRVTRSVSVTSHHRVPGGGVRVVARRVPGVDGLSWAVRYDEGTNPNAPGVPDATARIVADLAAAQHDPTL